MARIVYIDDDRAVLRSLSGLLRLEGFDVVTFEDGESALEFFRNEDADLVLCDYRMPDMNGIELRNKLDKDIVFVILSGTIADASSETAERPIADYIAKPARPRDLATRLRELLSE
jgi:two-component system response regulator HydG